jgi:hypothetical protein
MPAFTYHPTEVRVTQLDLHGNPTGPTWRLPVQSATLTTNTDTQPKEHTAMTTDRRTKPELREALIDTEQQLYEARDAEGAAKRRAAELEARQAGDDEALALDQCVRALERMLAAGEQRDRTRAYSQPLRASYGDTDRPTALDSPVGRILLHLAARYGVDIVAPHPALPDEPTLADQGDALLVVPQVLANTISQLLNDQPYLTERLAR